MSLVDVTEKPSISRVVVLTVAALGSLMACLVLLTCGCTNGRLLAFGLLVSALLVVTAIGTWVTYFRKWVDFEILGGQESTPTKQ
jgi:hypothetical protein